MDKFSLFGLELQQQVLLQWMSFCEFVSPV
jgi:hypothetical protein